MLWRALFASNNPNKGVACVDPDSHREPWAIRMPVTRGTQESLRGLDGPARVLRSGEARDVETDHLVSDQPVNERVCPDQHISGHDIEPVYQSTEVYRAHFLGQRR